MTLLLRKFHCSQGGNSQTIQQKNIEISFNLTSSNIRVINTLMYQWLKSNNIIYIIQKRTILHRGQSCIALHVEHRKTHKAVCYRFEQLLTDWDIAICQWLLLMCIMHSGWTQHRISQEFRTPHSVWASKPLQRQLPLQLTLMTNYKRCEWLRISMHCLSSYQRTVL